LVRGLAVAMLPDASPRPAPAATWQALPDIAGTGSRLHGRTTSGLAQARPQETLAPVCSSAPLVALASSAGLLAAAVAQRPARARRGVGRRGRWSPSTCTSKRRLATPRAASSAGHAAEASVRPGGLAAWPGAERFLWEWRPKVDVHFVRQSPEGDVQKDFAVVMVHGFGAEGSYYRSQLEAVATLGGTAYAVDLLGQGSSWPSVDPTGRDADGNTIGEGEWGWGDAVREEFGGEGLAFGEPTWMAQIDEFVKRVVKEDHVYLLGNSVGGYLAAKVAARAAETGTSKIAGLALANATPFWGWTQEGAWAPWDGRLPAPSWVRPVASAWFGALRGSIGQMLGMVYATPKDGGPIEARLGQLAERIAAAAAHPMGAAAFASILFAPKQEPTYGDALDSLAARRLPVLLLYGEDDPWIVPWWARRSAERIQSGGGEYYALTPAGHCPHHESPEAFNQVLLAWLARREGLEEPAETEGSRSSQAVQIERRL